MLRVWLPLTKDLRQQGLSNVTVTNNGATYSSTGGKLGGCYVLDGSNDRIQISNLPQPQNISVAMWFKRGANTNTRQFLFTAWNGITLELSTSGTVTCSVATADGQVGYCSTNTAITTSTGWTHICFTFENGVGTKLYINGVFQTATAVAKPISWSTTTGNIGYFNTYLNASVNDFRLYDHALSQMEVKELSKGLVLHYPLNRGGWGQDNLMPNSIEMPAGSANPSTGTWRLAGSSQMTRSRVAISDAPSGASTYGFQSVGLQTGQDASCWGIDGFPRENGTTYTLSAWGRIVGGSSTAAMLGFSVYSGTTLDYGGTYGKAVSSDAKYYGSGACDYAGGQLNPSGNWTRIYRTFTSTSTSDNIYIGFNTAKTGSNVTLQLCGVKLEKGNKMTPWTPSITDSLYTAMGLNGTTEYDCSGFCNNGTRIGTFNWTSDTPKYQVSTIFNGSNTLIEKEGLPIETKTIACWINWYSLPSGYTIPIHDKQSGLAIGITSTNRLISYVGTSSGGTGSCVDVSLVTNQWYHVVVIKTGDTTRDVYINGEKITSITTNNWWGGDTNNLYIGGRRYGGSYRDYFNGLICDVRAYATALSADDVKSLYQNSAYIDSSGNVYGAVHSEV